MTRSFSITVHAIEGESMADTQARLVKAMCPIGDFGISEGIEHPTPTELPTYTLLNDLPEPKTS